MSGISLVSSSQGGPAPDPVLGHDQHGRRERKQQVANALAVPAQDHRCQPQSDHRCRHIGGARDPPVLHQATHAGPTQYQQDEAQSHAHDVKHFGIEPGHMPREHAGEEEQDREADNDLGWQVRRKRGPQADQPCQEDEPIEEPNGGGWDCSRLIPRTEWGCRRGGHKESTCRLRACRAGGAHRESDSDRARRSQPIAARSRFRTAPSRTRTYPKSDL